jgi:hypothetical protein
LSGIARTDEGLVVSSVDRTLPRVDEIIAAPTSLLRTGYDTATPNRQCRARRRRARAAGIRDRYPHLDDAGVQQMLRTYLDRLDWLKRRR